LSLGGVKQGRGPDSRLSVLKQTACGTAAIPCGTSSSTFNDNNNHACWQALQTVDLHLSPCQISLSSPLIVFQHRSFLFLTIDLHAHSLTFRPVCNHRFVDPFLVSPSLLRLPIRTEESCLCNYGYSYGIWEGVVDCPLACLLQDSDQALIDPWIGP
jgi:hypothetical protein